MKILVVGPSDTKSRGGMATVINGIRKSKVLNKEFDIDIYPSYIDGNFFVRFIYSIYAYIRFMMSYKKYDLFHIHVASFGSTFRKKIYLDTVKRAGKKVIVHIHGAKYLEFYAGLKRSKKKKVVDFLNAANIVLVLSGDWKDKFESTFHISNCHFLNNGIDIDEYAVAVKNPEEYRNSFLLLGRLGVRKGAYDLVKAMELVVKQRADIKLYMAGDGEIEQISELVKEKGLEKNIDIVGWVDYDKKLELLKKVSTVVLPSYNEGLPMSVLEGMACGKAIISTTVGAIPEVVKEENGILINPGDIESLADAIISCSNDVDRLCFMSKKNIELIKEHFSIKNMHEQLGALYHFVEDKAADKESL